MPETVQFEPGSELHASSGDVQTHALVSIAISLKRIADTITYDPNNTHNLFDVFTDIMHNTRGAP